MELKYIIPDIPPSNNEYIGKSKPWQYQAKKKEWAAKVRCFCCPTPEKPIKKATVKIEYYFKDNRRRDPDNYSGKMILGGLVSAGILADDSFKVITLELRGNLDRIKPHTEITVKFEQE